MANIDLTKYGITGTTEIVHNPSFEMLFEEETNPNLEGFDKGQVSELGAVNVMTGIYTGRSPKDKFIVMDENSKDTVWWTSDEYKNDNHPATQEAWDAVKEIAIERALQDKRLFVVDAFCGANKDTRMAIRFIMEVAWQAHFVTNMFIRPTAEELESFEPDFVVYNASKAKVENYKELGLRLRDSCYVQYHKPRAGNCKYMVRRRDEERYVLHDELLSAAEGHRFHALLCKHRYERREHSYLLRTFRNR